MAKLTGPLLSIGARGQIAKSQVYASWKGIRYARRYVIPANPNTEAQQETRSTFSMLDGLYKYMQTNAQAPWVLAAKGKPIIPRNGVISTNLPILRGETDITNIIMSPGVKGGLPLSGLTAETGASSGEIDATATVPGTPVDWTMNGVTFIAQPQREPTELVTEVLPEAQVTASPWTTTFDSLSAGDDYVISAFIEWERADGQTAYGVSKSVVATAAS